MEQVAATSSGELPKPSPRDQDDDEYYKSDDFRMNSMKVVPCAKRFAHDWTLCPFSHPKEQATRRDPKLHTYTGIACPSMKKEGTCAFGDHCPYAHNVFEYWLHPTRYRTQLCNDGLNCSRKICFFAHSLDELRVPACKPFVSPEGLAAAAAAADEVKRRAGLMSSPIPSLNLPVASSRLSTDSVRQSTEWGPAAMPTPALTSSGSLSGGDQSSPETSVDAQDLAALQADQQPQQNAVRFSPHEQQIIEAVTNMLAQNKLNAAQAATILQQMLPSNSLQMLQSRLGVPTIPGGGEEVGMKAMSDPLNLRSPLPFSTTLSGPGQQNQEASTSPRQSFDMSVGAGSARQSMESARSSFDTARYSFDGRRMSSDAATTPRASMDYVPPAPAYPQDQHSGISLEGRPPLPPRSSPTQVAAPAAAIINSINSNSQQAAIPRYWTGQQLTTVPEGLPMINTPHSIYSVRHSTGNMDTTNAAGRLSSDFIRMSFEEPNNMHASAGAVNPGAAVNPYASAFFAGGGFGGGMQQPPQNEFAAAQRGVW